MSFNVLQTFVLSQRFATTTLPSRDTWYIWAEFNFLFLCYQMLWDVKKHYSDLNDVSLRFDPQNVLATHMKRIQG